MTSRKNKNLNKTILIATMLLSLSCPIYAENTVFHEITKSESQTDSTSNTLSETALNELAVNIPPADIPDNGIINSFFAPVDELPEPDTEISQPMHPQQAEESQQPQQSQQITQDEIPAQTSQTKATEGFKELSVQIEDNPFKIMDTIVLPSEYKLNKPKIKTENIESQNQDKTEQIRENEQNYDYTASAKKEKQTLNEEYEGKTISGVNFKGIFYTKEKTLKNVVKTEKGSLFNTERIQDDLQNVYALGYYTDSMYVEPELQKDGTVTITFVLEENITVKKAEIKGNTVFKSSELYPLVKKLENMPQNINLVNESIEKINKYYQDNGYILAKVTNIEDNADGILVFVISEGIIQEINLEGNEKTRDYIIERNILTKPGAVYNEEFIKKDLAKIYSTQIFDKVDREITPSPDRENEYIVTIKIKEACSNDISIGLGIDNALGGFGSLSFHEKNFMGKNQKLSLTGMLGSGILLSDASIKNRMNWNIELNFFEPHLISENNKFSSKLYYRDLGSYQVPLAIERRWGWNNTLEHKVMGYDNLTSNLAVGFENIHLKEGDLNRIATIYRRSNVDFSKRKEQLEGGFFINVAPGLKYSSLDNENMPREGLIAKANFIESFSLSNSRHTNGKLIGSITKYIPIAKKSTLLISAKGGYKVHGESMPEVMAFRLGGPYTIRGFRMNGVGSGESFVMASTELQTPIPFMDKVKYDFFKNLRFAFFVDAGKVFEPTITSTLYDRPLSAVTAGVGLRINIPGMSTITVDYGIPFTHTGRYNSKHGYFTFGTGGLYDSY